MKAKQKPETRNPKPNAERSMHDTNGKILAAMSDGRYGVKEAIALVTNNPAERKEIPMFTRDKLMAALARVQTAIEQGKVLSADAHAAMCECGSDCWEHSCIVGAFLLALDRTCLYDKFPAVLRMEELFDEMGLPALADRAWRIATLNEQGRLEEAFNELKSAVKSC
jgi:hypothetical protein